MSAVQKIAEQSQHQMPKTTHFAQNTDLSQKHFENTNNTSENIMDDQREISEKADELSIPLEMIPLAHIKQEPTANIEDFLYSGTSMFSQNAESANNEEKGIPLRKFPAIARAVETADYEVLQDLYLVLYLRNAWDTEKVLIQGILDFSGFNCSPGSEDFDTRKLTLCTFSNDVLYKIKNLLGVQTFWTYHPNSTASAHSSGSEQAKLDAVERILNFLRRPAKKSRQRRSRANADGNLPQQRSQQKPPKACTSYDTSSSVTIDHSDDLKNIKAGPIGFEVEASSLSDSEILKIENNLKEKIAKGNAAQVKVILEKLDKDILAEKLKNYAANAPVSESPPDQLPTPVQPLQSSEEGMETKLAEKEDTVNSKSTENEKEVNAEKRSEKEDGVVGNEGSAISQNTTAELKRKLKDFPLVLSCIEGTPKKLLIELYFILFLEKAGQEIDEIKGKILQFDGFPFKEDSQEFRIRKSVLGLMSEEMVKDITRSLYLDPKSDKASTEALLLNFLRQPSEELLRPTVIAPGMLEDIDVDIDDLFDSDSDSDSDSDGSEIVEFKVAQKIVECVDLLSSDEDDKAEKVVFIATPILKSMIFTPAAFPLPSSSAATAQPAPPPATQMSRTQGCWIRTLRDFITIKKIVEMHPNEYLVGIYNLLYMKNCQPESLRNAILDFGGFDFDKTSPEYTKRKLFLDRMQYNSVRRIYNTLIHNTREVKVFSKPTMIGEIFQFLLKLPDHDTSVLPPRSQPVTKTYSNCATVSNIVVSDDLQIKEEPAKLSDLQRVFQRVTCFPCEYLADVHKLLFMTDCDMKEIRKNIFNFKGFNFSVGSPEFNQRKMFLEYLTFHSLRKISSVLTTKTVDMRNSTKHELANHLIEVLKEYTEITYDPEPLKPAMDVAVVSDVETSSMASISSNSTVEEIVVTPIILPLHSNPPHNQSEDMTDVTVSSSISGGNSKQHSPPQENLQQSASAAKAKPSSITSMSSVNNVATTSSMSRTFGKVIGGSSRRVDSPQIRSQIIRNEIKSSDFASSSIPTVKPQPQKQSIIIKVQDLNTKKRKASEPPAVPLMQQSMQFADINLPDIEKYRQIYPSKPNMLSKPPLPPAVNVSSSSRLTFQPDFLFQQVSQASNMLQPPIPGIASQRLKNLTPRGIGPPMIGPQLLIMHSTPLMASNVQLPLMHSFQPPQHPLLNPAFFVQPPPFFNSTDSVSAPVSSILQEGNPMGLPGQKRFKQMIKTFPDDPHPNRAHLDLSEIENPSSSLQLKIRDAMTKTDDEEDCNKPLAMFVGHPSDRVLKQQICEIVENTDLQDISMNGVIQKIYNMYPNYDLKYRKEFIKSSLRSLLYRLGDTDVKKELLDDPQLSVSDMDSSVTTTNERKSIPPCEKSSQ